MAATAVAVRRRASAPPVTGDSSTRGRPAAASEAIRQLRARYRDLAPRIIEAFRGSALQLAASPDDEALLDALRRDLHRVHGTAGSYGYHDASRLAAALEERAARWCDDPTLEAAERAGIVARFATALETVFRAPDAAGRTE